MQVTKKTHLQIRLQNIIFVALFLVFVAMLAWLGERYNVSSDWTKNSRNTLSDSSIALLKKIDGPISITSFVSRNEQIENFVQRYQNYKEDIKLNFIDPDIEPQLARENGVRVKGELVLRYGERRENLQTLTEQAMTNALQRLARNAERFIVFLEGHGERSPRGRANHDLSDWAVQLESRGINTQTINLGVNQQIPSNASALVIASPQVNLLPGEVSIIGDYLAKGGNLLWLADPGEAHGLGVLAEQLGIEFHPGMVVDPTTQRLGLNDPRITIIAEYGTQAVTNNFSNLTLFPQASAIELIEGSEWQADPFLITAPDSWSETGELQGELALDAGEDIPGPLNIGVILTRNTNTEAALEQRVIVIGDGDFLSNQYLGNAGNQDLGLNLANWLSRDDAFINIPAKTSSDLSLEFSASTAGIIGLIFILLPLILLATGFIIWQRRRRT
ncbi:MAG: GldG family protein [Sulfuriflexus sp.]|nr:GldG family protein [Sulfuriflexus sp.]